MQSQHHLFLQPCTVFRQVLSRELHILKHFPVSHKLYDTVGADCTDPVSAQVCYPSHAKRSFSGQLITTKNSGCPPKTSQSTNLLKKGKHNLRTNLRTDKAGSTVLLCNLGQCLVLCAYRRLVFGLMFWCLQNIKK